MVRLAFVLLIFTLSACSHVNLTPEAREQQCLDYGFEKGTPEYAECDQKERQLAQDFLWGDDD